MEIGFTGTQIGLKFEQTKSLSTVLNKLKSKGNIKCHHGDCIGADAEFHSFCKALHFYIIIHPPIDSKKRQFCTGYDEIRKEKEYLDRNKDIVDESDVLIATPGEEHEVWRSGTWSTIRYAKKKKKKIIIIYPNGKVESIKGE